MSNVNRGQTSVSTAGIQSSILVGEKNLAATIIHFLTTPSTHY